ncbi:MAG: protein kinase [Planctomycetes bacterium]|nr:protein kinase [Planctomycetota bacterium]
MVAYTFKHGDRPLEGYTIQRAVGRGGFGEVYYAVSDGGREVALKYLRENPQIELRGVAHCINLKSPHLVSIFDVKKNEDGEYFVIMEYSSGPSLRDILLAEPNGVGAQKAAFFLREIAKGLGYLHDRGIVHRDLKPGNIFFDEGYVKIGDYGLSKFISVSRHSAQTASVGTVHYMAPEVGSGNYHRGIDIYAMGVMLYEMLLGKVPFEGSSMGEVLMKHLTEQPEVDNLPQPFGKIIHKALQKDPNDRYQNVYEMIDDLMEVEDIRTSLAGFSPVSLSGAVQRMSPAADSPVPSPNPAPRQHPALKPRGNRKPFNLNAGDLPPQMAKKFKRTSAKVANRMRKLDSRYGQRAPAPDPGDVTDRRPLRVQGDAPQTRTEFIQRALLALAMAVGLGLGVAILTDVKDEGFVSAILMIVGMAGGLAVGCRLVAYASQRRKQPVWVERFCLTVPTAFLIGLGSLPLLDVEGDETVISIMGALIGVTLFSNWRKRIKAGSMGKLSAAHAFSAGLFALILTAIFSGGDNGLFFSAGIAAASSLVFQALAWLFPLHDWINGRQVTVNVFQGVSQGASADTRSQDNPETGDPSSQETIAIHRPGAPTLPPDDLTGPTDSASSFLIQGPPKRWTLTRVLGGLLGFACLVGLVSAIVYFFSASTHSITTTYTNGVYAREYERHGLEPIEKVRVVVAAAAFLGIMLLAFRKVRRHRTGGIYRDTLRPLLLTAILMGLAWSISVQIFETDFPGLLAPARIVLVVSSILLLSIMVVRGKRLDGTVRASNDPPSGDHRMDDSSPDQFIDYPPSADPRQTHPS